jgi:tetratricopeptide (TPR) repeat protein
MDTEIVVDLLGRDTRNDFPEFWDYANLLLEFIISSSTEKVIDNERVQQNYIDDTLFNAIMTNTDGLVDEMFIRNKLLKDYEKYPFWQRSLVVSALTLSLSIQYDERKVHLLIDFIIANEDFVWQKALVGLFIALYGREDKYKRDLSIINKLKDLRAYTNVQKGLVTIALAFDKLQNEKNFILNFSNEIKLKEQMSYFEKPAHWFLPFYEGNPALKECLPMKKPLPKLLLESISCFAPVCKYAYCKNYENFSDWQHTSTIEILIGDRIGLQTYYPEAKDYMKAAALENIYKETFNELFIFHLSYPGETLRTIFKQTSIYNQPAFQIVSTDNTIKEVEAQLWFNRGNAYSEKEAYDQAIGCYQKAIAINPDKYDAYYNMGYAHGKNDDYDQAIECYQKAIAIKSNMHEAYNNMGDAHEKNGDYTQAIECYQKAIDIKPDKYEAYYNMGVAHEENGNHAQAIGCYQKAIAIKPDDHEAYYGMGVAHEENEDYAQAIECYQKAIDIKPDEHEVHHKMGVTYQKNGDYAQAIKCYQKAIAINPDEYETYYVMGYAYSQNGDYVQAIACFQKAIAINPNYVAAMINLGFVYIEQGYLEQAEKFTVMGIEHGSKGFGNMNLGHIYFAQKRVEDAFEKYTMSLSAFTDKDVFFAGYDDDYQYLKQYGISEKDYADMRKRLS